MENQARTAEHVSRINLRRNILNKKLACLISCPASVVWEIGCGHGHFLTAYATAHTHELCVGVDISRDRIERSLRKRDRAKLGNLHFIQAEANDFLDSLPAGVTLSAIYILFPDPWPKRRHHKNRIMQPDFLHALAGRAGEDARLYFRTDYEPYFREAELLLDRHPDWQTIAGPWPFEQITVFQGRAASHHSLIAQHRRARTSVRRQNCA